MRFPHLLRSKRGEVKSKKLPHFLTFTFSFFLVYCSFFLPLSVRMPIVLMPEKLYGKSRIRFMDAAEIGGAQDILFGKCSVPDVKDTASITDVSSQAGGGIP
jgi:hypothetical protein